MGTLSVCMIVRDAERSVGAILEDCKAFADEIVVVDTGSKDGTKEAVLGAGSLVRLYEHPWEDSFSKARNQAWDHATCDHIIVLDADDRVPEKDQKKILALKESLDGTAAYDFMIHNLNDKGAYECFAQPRIFPNRPEIRYEGRVHNTAMPSVERLGMPVRPAHIRVIHNGYSSPEVVKAKHERTLRLLEIERKEAPDDPKVLVYLGMLYETYGREAEAVPLLERVIEELEKDFEKRPFGLYQAYPHAIRAHKKLGNIPRAIRHWKKFNTYVTVYPPFRLVATGLAEDLGLYEEILC